ncbi:MAG TPA: GTPase [Fimbriimonas sp.]|nr:GTPase [Fimbriimonas sp.]
MLIVVSGPSGVGKSTLLNAIADSFPIGFAVPVTTRCPRAEEVDGRDYDFITVEAFHELIRRDALACWDFALDNYYGYRKDLLSRLEDGQSVIIHCLARMGVRLSRSVDNSLLILLKPRSVEALEMRLQLREYSEQELALRRSHWHEEVEHSPLFDVVVEDADVAEPESLSAAVAEILNQLR